MRMCSFLFYRVQLAILSELVKQRDVLDKIVGDSVMHCKIRSKESSRFEGSFGRRKELQTRYSLVTTCGECRYIESGTYRN